jgi:phosphatidylglycerol---prolipoprotein diacylglyceryl transferase
VLPVLFSVAGLKVYAYGVAIAVGFSGGILYAVRASRREGLPHDLFWDLALAYIVGGVAGARLEYVRTHPARFFADPAQILALREGGLVFYGGLAGALVAAAAVVAWRKVPLWRALDLSSVGLAIGLSVTRVGCFLSGCCYGAPTSLPWGVVYPEGAHPPSGVPLHPTQLYESLACATMAAYLAWRRPRRRFDGELVGTFFVAYPVFRAFNESIRGDLERGYAFGTVTNGQATSALLLLVGIAVLVARARTSAATPDTAR